MGGVRIKGQKRVAWFVLVLITIPKTMYVLASPPIHEATTQTYLLTSGCSYSCWPGRAPSGNSPLASSINLSALLMVSRWWWGGKVACLSSSVQSLAVVQWLWSSIADCTNSKVGADIKTQRARAVLRATVARGRIRKMRGQSGGQPASQPERVLNLRLSAGDGRRLAGRPLGVVFPSQRTLVDLHTNGTPDDWHHLPDWSFAF